MTLKQGKCNQSEDSITILKDYHTLLKKKKAHSSWFKLT